MTQSEQLSGAGREYSRLDVMREDPRNVLKRYGALVASNAGIYASENNPTSFHEKGKLASEAAALYAKEMSGRRFQAFVEGPLMAADNTDGNLGTLSGTLAVQRSLELYRLHFPAISRIYTDFSDEPGVFKRTVATRIVVTPAVQTYDPTLGDDNRPKGWGTVTPAKTIDVPITLDEHVGVPIVFDSNTLGSTLRRLFEEQAPAASYALAKYFIEKIYAQMTPANFNAYAKVNGAKVPKAYDVYKVAEEDFARSSLTKISSIFNPNEVPIADRTVLLNTSYYAQLSNDPSLVTFYAGQRAPEIITDNELPKLSTFVPVEAPNLANSNNTPNLGGFAMHKTGIVAKSRVPADYTQALPGSGYGNVVTVTDPETKLSVLNVQYVNHTGGYAESRIAAMIGAAPGDKRGGMCITA